MTISTPKNVDKNCIKTSARSKGIGLISLIESLCIFRSVDSDGDGRISKEEFKNGFKTLGLSPPCKQAFASISQVDAYGNRYIGRDKIEEPIYLVPHAMDRGYIIKE